MIRLRIFLIFLAVIAPEVALATMLLTGVGGITSGLPAFQAAISTLANGTAGDAFDSNPTFIPPTAATYETTVSVLTADELFGGL